MRLATHGTAMLSALAAVALCAPAGAAGLRIGFLDDARLANPDPATRAQWMGDARGVGATTLRFNVQWAQIAPQAPPSGEAADPAWTGYRWGTLDAAVRDATAAGLRPLLTFSQAPAWAWRGQPPAGLDTSGWRPDPTAFAAFVRATALRYRGDFTPPGDTTPLPAVQYWQAWNEPNLSLYLAPQWVRSGGHFVAESPALFRGLLNAAYAVLKAISSANYLVAGGTAPFGDPQKGGLRIPPVDFDRELLCLGVTRCSSKPHFDALDHHPYGVGGPQQHALNPGDVTIPDLGKLRRLLVRAHMPRPIWVTEFSWDSNPPDPDGVPAQRHARWLEAALYAFWRAHVPVAMWLEIADQAPVPSYAATYQSGLFLLDGTPKPAAAAMTFPFVGQPVGKRRVQLWGMAPTGVSSVTVQRLVGGVWRPWVRLAANARIFARTIRLDTRVKLRAVSADASSLPWTPGVDGR